MLKEYKMVSPTELPKIVLSNPGLGDKILNNFLVTRYCACIIKKVSIVTYQISHDKKLISGVTQGTNDLTFNK